MKACGGARPSCDHSSPADDLTLTRAARSFLGVARGSGRVLAPRGEVRKWLPDGAKRPLPCPGETGGRGRGRVRLAWGAHGSQGEKSRPRQAARGRCACARGAGLSVELPVERAQELLRPLASAAYRSRG